MVTAVCARMLNAGRLRRVTSAEYDVLLNQPLWTRESVRRMLDEAADGRDPETVHLVQLWMDGMHSRIFYLIKAFCGDNQMPQQSGTDPFPRDCLRELVGGCIGEPIEQPAYVGLLQDHLQNLVCRGLDSYFEGVFHEEELRRRALCNYLWTYVGE